MNGARRAAIALAMFLVALHAPASGFEFSRYEDTTVEALLERARAFDDHEDGQSVLTPPLPMHFTARIASMPEACDDKLPLMLMRAVAVKEQPPMRWCMRLRGDGGEVVSAWVQDAVAPFIAREYKLGDAFELWAVWLFVNASDKKPYLVVNAIGPAATAADRRESADPELPLADGDYTFTHRFAEQPDMPGTPLAVRVDGDRITLRNDGALEAFPKGVIAEGRLMWHAASRQWIVGSKDADRVAPEVGGCSDGPAVVDLEKRIYWTC